MIFQSLILTIATKIFQPIKTSHKCRFTTVAIAISIALLDRTISLAGSFPQPTVIVALTSSVKNQLVDGIALYGESTRPDAIGKQYIIFEKLGNRVIGAFYLPRSEFSCFYGNFKGSKLNITLIDSYDNKEDNYALAFKSDRAIAIDSPMMSTPTYQLLKKVSTNDRRILTICKSQLGSRRS